MKLDNRPRKLLVKGVPAESVEVAQNWYGVRIFPCPTPSFVVECEGLQTTNGIESVERLADGDLIVSFKTRSSAEQARRVLLDRFPLIYPGSEQGYAKGTNLPTVGQIEASWYTPAPGPPNLSKPAPSEQPASAEMGGGTTSGGSAVPEKGAPEEETVASGWGDDGEDGMGML